MSDLLLAEQADQPLLAGVHQRIARDQPRLARHWVTKLPRHLKVGRAVGHSLAGRGVLEERRTKVLGLFARTTWPERDPGPERRLRAELTGVLVGGLAPTAATASLIGLLEALGVTRRLLTGGLDPEQRKRARAAAKAIGRDQRKMTGVSSAVAISVREAQAAITSATAAAVAASAAAAGSS